MSIIFRYFNREILRNFWMITALFGVIILGHLLSRLIQRVTNGKLALSDLNLAIMMESPRFLAVLLPFALYLAILLTYRRFYSHHEMVALTACGFGVRDLIRIMTPITLGVVMLTASLTHWISPQLLQRGREKLAKTGPAIMIQTLKPGRFQQTPDGQGVLYVESVSPNRPVVHRIFMATPLADQRLHPRPSDKTSSSAAPRWAILTALKGYQWQDPHTQARFFTAIDGRGISGTPGQHDYDLLRFQSLNFVLISKQAARSPGIDTQSTQALWRHRQDPEYAAELQWRISIPLSVILLTLLAIPLSYLQPRQGRYLPLLYALLLYIIYLNLLLIGRNWLKTQHIAMAWGLWWVHGLYLLTTLTAWILATHGPAKLARTLRKHG